MFATRVRYSGASIGAQFSSVAAGAPAPLIATALLADYGSATPIALYVMAASVLTLVAVGCARETRHRDLSDEPGESAGPDESRRHARPHLRPPSDGESLCRRNAS